MLHDQIYTSCYLSSKSFHLKRYTHNCKNGASSRKAKGLLWFHESGFAFKVQRGVYTVFMGTTNSKVGLKAVQTV
jgi:hypothetical protein